MKPPLLALIATLAIAAPLSPAAANPDMREAQQERQRVMDAQRERAFPGTPTLRRQVQGPGLAGARAARRMEPAPLPQRPPVSEGFTAPRAFRP